MIFIEENDDRFYIAPSTIPSAGNGCFAKELLKRNDCLEIVGVYVRTGSVADFCTEYARRYKFASSEKCEAKIVPFGFGGMVNHTDDPELQNCKLEFTSSYRRRSQHAGQVVYRFKRDIQPKEELLGNYGRGAEQEINAIFNNFNFFEQNKKDFLDFLQFDLYHMKDLYSMLS